MNATTGIWVAAFPVLERPAAANSRRNTKTLHGAQMTATKQLDAAKGDGAPGQSGLRRMLSEEQVLATVPVSRTTLYRMEKAGRFPRSTYISPNRRVWYVDEIVAWQNAVNEFDPSRGRGKGRRRHASG